MSEVLPDPPTPTSIALPAAALIVRQSLSKCARASSKMTRAIFLTCLDRVRPLTTDAEHVDGSLVQLDEHAVVDLPQTEQLQNLLDLGGHLRKKVLRDV